VVRVDHPLLLRLWDRGERSRPGIAATSGGDAITINVTTSDPVTLSGLVIDGGGTGNNGIFITSGKSVQVLNSVIRHFGNAGIFQFTSTPGANLLIEDTVASDNLNIGIVLEPNGLSLQATLSRITANNNNALGILTTNNSSTTIANSVMSNNSAGLSAGPGVAWLAKTVISGNTTGVFVFGTLNSYGDNYIGDNGTPVVGSLTPVTTQ
jgi:Right handed beta helix region